MYFVYIYCLFARKHWWHVICIIIFFGWFSSSIFYFRWPPTTVNSQNIVFFPRWILAYINLDRYEQPARVQQSLILRHTYLSIYKARRKKQRNYDNNIRPATTLNWNQQFTIWIWIYTFVFLYLLCVYEYVCT